MEYNTLAQNIVENVGGKENIKTATHCMTRLRFALDDVSKADMDAIKSLDGVVGVVFKGGQYQVIIGPEVASVYDEVVKLMPKDQKLETVSSDGPKEKLSFKSAFDNVLDALSGCMTPLIPILLCAGFAKTIVAVFGPQLLGWISETSSLYILFSFVGDAGFYFMPVFVGYTAARKFGVSEIMGIFLGAILIHPSLLQLVETGATFDVYGIPVMLQNYTQTLIPVALSVWVMSYVEGFFKKYTPKALRVFGVPFGTLLVMLPLSLAILGPLGAFIGNYIGAGIIALYDVAGPLALGVLGAVFALLVMTGMHTVLFTFLFVSFPILGYDAFIIPAMIASSWASVGVTIACIFKFKDPTKKSLTIGYALTWFFGGVGEPMLYGLNVPYRTPMYASIIAGFFSGLIAGFLGLKAYVLNLSNGIYGLASFFGGPQYNYVALAITLVASTVIGFVVMWFMKLDESLVK